MCSPGTSGSFAEAYRVHSFKLLLGRSDINHLLQRYCPNFLCQDESLLHAEQPLDVITQYYSRLHSEEGSEKTRGSEP